MSYPPNGLHRAHFDTGYMLGNHEERISDLEAWQEGEIARRSRRLGMLWRHGKRVATVALLWGAVWVISAFPPGSPMRDFGEALRDYLIGL